MKTPPTRKTPFQLGNWAMARPMEVTAPVMVPT